MKDYKKVIQGGNEAYNQYVVVGHRHDQEHAYIVTGDEDGNEGVASLDMDALRGFTGCYRRHSCIDGRRRWVTVKQFKLVIELGQCYQLRCGAKVILKDTRRVLHMAMSSTRRCLLILLMGLTYSSQRTRNTWEWMKDSAIGVKRRGSRKTDTLKKLVKGETRNDVVALSTSTVVWYMLERHQDGDRFFVGPRTEMTSKRLKSLEVKEVAFTTNHIHYPTIGIVSLGTMPFLYPLN